MVSLCTRSVPKIAALLVLISLGLCEARFVFAEQSGRSEPAAARDLFQMLNRERTRAGLKALIWDERLAAAARGHAELLVRHQRLSHDFTEEPRLQVRLSRVPLSSSGENLGVGSEILEVHRGLMHSPPHRANILSPKYDAVGIGVIQQDGRYWVVQDFAQRIPEMPDAQAEVEAATAAVHMRPGLHTVKDSRVHQLACRMARSGQLDEKPALALPGAHRVVAYTSANPGELPEDARRVLGMPDSSHYAVGACFARSAQYPSGVYWVLMVLFGK